MSVNIMNRRILMTQALASGFTPTSSQSAAFLARATDVVSITDKTNYDTMITGLVTDGVWSKLDALYIFAAVDRTTALLNLVSNTFNCTEHGTINFSAYQGYTGDSSTFYLDSGFTPNAGGTLFSLNSANLGAYQTLALTSGIVCGDDRGIGNGNFINNQTAAFGHITLALNGAGPAIPGASNGQGYWIVTINSTTVFSSLNGAAPGTTSGTPNGLDINPLTFFAYTQGVGPPPNVFGSPQITAAHFGGLLNSSDITHLSNRINAYMTAYGINVY